MAGWLPTPSPGAGGSLQAWLIGQNSEEAPSWASVAHAGHPGLSYQLALITPNGLLALMNLQILLKLQRLIDLIHPRQALLNRRQHLFLQPGNLFLSIGPINPGAPQRPAGMAPEDRFDGFAAGLQQQERILLRPAERRGS